MTEYHTITAGNRKGLSEVSRPVCDCPLWHLWVVRPRTTRDGERGRSLYTGATVKRSLAMAGSWRGHLGLALHSCTPGRDALATKKAIAKTKV